MNNIKKIRFERNLTQIQLYKMTGIWPSRLSLIENNHIEALEGEKQKLTRSLCVSRTRLFPEEDSK